MWVHEVSFYALKVIQVLPITNIFVNVVHFLASFALASMTGNSVFVISPGGYVFERFWNQANWVYVRHNGLPSSPIVHLSTIKQGGTLFASTAEGILYQRIARGFSSPIVLESATIQK